MIIQGDALEKLKNLSSNSVDCCITSPPYYQLRDYGIEGQIGLEKTVDEYIEKLVEVFREVRRVLKPDGTLWVNIADCYAGSGKGKGQTTPLAKVQASNKGILSVQKHSLIRPSSIGMKPKDLMGIPWLLALALRADGWYLRQDIIWHKPNPMPESVTDRCTKSHEYIFLLSKSTHYYFDYKAIEEPVVGHTAERFDKPPEHAGEKLPRYGGKKYTEHPDKFYRTKSGHAYDFRPTRRKRDVWDITTKPYKGAHFATFPKDLIEPCVLAGSRVGGTVLDPFAGSGTTGEVAKEHGRDFILIELSTEYIPLIERRIAGGGYKIIIFIWNADGGVILVISKGGRMNKNNNYQFQLKQKILGELSIRSAVKTALESRYLSLEYIAVQAPHMAFKHFVKGGLADDWWSEFWRNYGLLEAQSLQAIKNGTRG